MRDVSNYVETIEGRSPQRISFAYHFQNCPKQVMVDATINRIFFHLFRNAVRFRTDRAYIKIEIGLVEEDFIEAPVRSRKGLTFDNSALGGLYSFKITNNTVNPVDLKLINHDFRNSYSCVNDRSNDSNGLLRRKD